MYIVKTEWLKITKIHVITSPQLPPPPPPPPLHSPKTNSWSDIFSRPRSHEL